MNPHDDKPEDAQDEERIAAILKAVETDAAPPDPAVLAQVRTQSTDAFRAASPRPMYLVFFRRARWFAATAAAVIIGVGLYFWLAPGPSNIALGQVLEKQGNKADATKEYEAALQLASDYQPARDALKRVNGK